MKNRNYSVDLEHDEYATNIDLVIHNALKAVAETGVGYYVNTVTPASFGTPIGYLTDRLESHLGNGIRYEFIDHCGCGGYVLPFLFNSGSPVPERERQAERRPKEFPESEGS